MVRRIGIDFGTANTVVVEWDQTTQRGESIPLDGIDLVWDPVPDIHQRVIPSLIAFDPAGKPRWIGAQVQSKMREPAGANLAVFQSTKSIITGRTIDVGRMIGGRRLTGREAATTFLSAVMAAAMLVAGDDDVEIVATAPVEAFDPYRDWLVREVGEALGRGRLRVVDEATAAAVGYSARLSPGQVFVVFDFGAGTLDVSVVRVQEPADASAGSGVKVIAKSGVDLGGSHIDAVLAKHVAGEIQLPFARTEEYNLAFGQLLAAAEAAKVQLTLAETALIRLRDPPVSHQVTRRVFDQLLKESDILGRVGRALRRTLDKASSLGFPTDEIAAVFLVGGTSLIPAVQDVVCLPFSPEIIHCDRPLEAVAAGAAGIAGGFELHDHIQHDYAIRHVNRLTGAYDFETIVKAGTEYPTADPVRTLTIKAVRDGQTRLGVAVYELAHATFRDSAMDLEIFFDEAGGAATLEVTPQRRQERSQIWLNEDSPTFLEANPPADAGLDRFRVEFRIDHHKRLTVSAFDLKRAIWVLDAQPIVRLA